MASRPELVALYSRFVGRLWTDRLVEPITLELCRLRIAQLHRDGAGMAERTAVAAVSEDLVAALHDWPTSSVFTDAHRAALAVCELFVIDAHSVTDDIVGKLCVHFPADEIVALVTAFGLFDGFTRFRLAQRGHL